MSVPLIDYAVYFHTAPDLPYPNLPAIRRQDLLDKLKNMERVPYTMAQVEERMRRNDLFTRLDTSECPPWNIDKKSPHNQLPGLLPNNNDQTGWIPPPIQSSDLISLEGGGGRGVVCHVFKLITKIYDWDRKLEIEF